MQLENIIFSETCQAQKDKYHKYLTKKSTLYRTEQWSLEEGGMRARHREPLLGTGKGAAGKGKNRDED
jgi:hypothetical protein